MLSFCQTYTKYFHTIVDLERSVVQFSKTSYPIIGTSTSVQIPVLRTGEHQRRVVVEWYTQDGTARQGIDYKLMRVSQTVQHKFFI